MVGGMMASGRKSVVLFVAARWQWYTPSSHRTPMTPSGFPTRVILVHLVHTPTVRQYPPIAMPPRGLLSSTVYIRMSLWLTTSCAPKKSNCATEILFFEATTAARSTYVTLYTFFRPRYMSHNTECQEQANEQNFAPFVQNVMSEKIKALRTAMSGSSSKTAQPAPQPAYGMSLHYTHVCAGAPLGSPDQDW